MRKIILILSMFLFSCTESKYREIGQDIIDGKVSATQEGTVGRNASYPKIWVQNATNTQMVEIPFQYENKWKVGDSCLLIIQKYEIIEEKSK